MKTQLFPYFVLTFFILVFASCNPKKALEDKINETIAEEVAGAILGTDVETSNISNIEKSTAMIDINIDGQKIDFQKSKPIFNIVSDSKDNIILALTLVGEKNNKQYSLQFGINAQKELLKLPLVANFGDSQKDGKVAPLFNITALKDKKMGIITVVEGTMKVVEFSDEKVVFEIDAKGGKNNVETHEGKNLFPIKGKIVCKNPVMTLIGVKKEEIFK